MFTITDRRLGSAQCLVLVPLLTSFLLVVETVPLLSVSGQDQDPDLIRRSHSVVETAPFYIGLNHFGNLLRCEDEDQWCQNASLFEKLYDGNKRMAAAAAAKQFHDWHFTGGGYNAPTEIMAAMPYYTALFLLSYPSGGPHPWRPTNMYFHPDPWNASVISSIQDTVKYKCSENKPFRHNNRGYLLTDFPGYDIINSQKAHGKDWVTSLRCASKDAPGKAVYLDFLKSKYGNTTALCKAYDLEASRCATTWEQLDLCNVRNTKSIPCLSDDYEFLPQIPQQIYTIAGDAIRSHDPDAVILGDTFVVSWVPDSIITLAGKMHDGLSIQPEGGEIFLHQPKVERGMSGVTFNRSEWDWLYQLGGNKPILIADLGFAFPRDPFQAFEWNHWHNQTAAGTAYRDYVLSAAKTPYIIGFQKCQYIDRVEEQPQFGLKTGLLNFDGTPHEPFLSLVTAANTEAVALRKSLNINT